MGSYAMPPPRDDDPPGRNNEASGGLGSLLSERLSAIELDSVETVRDERERN